jgi:hypothetical protein
LNSLQTDRKVRSDTRNAHKQCNATPVVLEHLEGERRDHLGIGKDEKLAHKVGEKKEDELEEGTCGFSADISAFIVPGS